MSEKWTLRQILENEADKKAVEDGFKRIDEATKNFPVGAYFALRLQVAHTSHLA
jgi:hypothetical protein